jgi:hypothetical protein
MSSMGNSSEKLPNADGRTLSGLLEWAGWIKSGGRQGLYERWVTREGSKSLSVTVPLDRSRDDYVDLLGDALSTIFSSPMPGARKIDLALKEPGDEVRWRKEVTSVRGLIPWLKGEELYTSAHQILSAAAKATRRPSTYFGPRHWKFARDFLSQVWMGQTEVGSYVITAYTPTGPILPSGAGPGESEFPRLVDDTTSSSDPISTGRDVVNNLTGSLTAARESIDHYSSTGSMSGFDDAVERGVSCELTRGLSLLVNGSEGAEISIRLANAPSASSAGDNIVLEFTPADLSALAHASTRLASSEPPRITVVIGTVTALSRPELGQLGTIRINVIYGAAINKVRVRLSNDQYQMALDAHKVGDLLRVVGDLQRENTYYYLDAIIDFARVDAGTINQSNMFGSIDLALLKEPIILPKGDH